MEYLSKGLKSVLGSGGSNGVENGAEAVERLCERLVSATLLDDRRDAVRALKSLSKKFQLEVGTKGMEPILRVLNVDRSDADIAGLCLETLLIIMSTEEHDTDPKLLTTPPPATDLGLMLTEIFLKKPENLLVIIGLLEEFEFRIRWPCVKFLRVLVVNKPAAVQQGVLDFPLCVSRMMDLLRDGREVIRNDVLLLFISLTRGNPALQKIMAFEDVFDRILSVISDEGYSDGGIVVDDCVCLLDNLLRSNISNQNLFREGSYMRRLIPFFEFDDDIKSDTWLPQKTKNIISMLQIIRILMSPSNPNQALANCQKSAFSIGLLKSLCSILMTSGCQVEVLTETINAIAEVIRGCQQNQDYFADLRSPGSSPRPAVVILLMSMINDKQPFPLKCAVLYCFQCYLYKNQKAQTEIFDTLLPASKQVNVLSAGQLLCAGLMSKNSLTLWLACTALAHAMKGSKSLKEQLLRVQVSATFEGSRKSLLEHCASVLTKQSSVQGQVGMLSLLGSWFHGCPLAVSQFLSNSENLPMLMHRAEEQGNEQSKIVAGLAALLIGIMAVYNDNSIPAFSREMIKKVILTRMDGTDFQERIMQVSRSETFSQAMKFPQITFQLEDQVLFDYEFTKMFKKLEVDIAQTFLTDQEEEGVESRIKPKPVTDHLQSVVDSYKILIKDQDDEIGVLKKKLADAEAAEQKASLLLQQYSFEYNQLRNHVELMNQLASQSSQEGAKVVQAYDHIAVLNQHLYMKDMHIHELEQRLSSQLQAQSDTTQPAATESGSLETAHSELLMAFNYQKCTAEENQKRLDQAHEEIAQKSKLLQDHTDQLETIKKDYEDLLLLLDDQDKELQALKDLSSRVQRPSFNSASTLTDTVTMASIGVNCVGPHYTTSFSQTEPLTLTSSVQVNSMDVSTQVETLEPVMQTTPSSHPSYALSSVYTDSPVMFQGESVNTMSSFITLPSWGSFAAGVLADDAGQPCSAGMPDMIYGDQASPCLEPSSEISLSLEDSCDQDDCNGPDRVGSSVRCYSLDGPDSRSSQTHDSPAVRTRGSPFGDYHDARNAFDNLRLPSDENASADVLEDVDLNSSEPQVVAPSTSTFPSVQDIFSLVKPSAIGSRLLSLISDVPTVDDGPVRDGSETPAKDSETTSPAPPAGSHAGPKLGVRAIREVDSTDRMDSHMAAKERVVSVAPIVVSYEPVPHPFVTMTNDHLVNPSGLSDPIPSFPAASLKSSATTAVVLPLNSPSLSLMDEGAASSVPCIQQTNHLSTGNMPPTPPPTEFFRGGCGFSGPPQTLHPPVHPAARTPSSLGLHRRFPTSAAAQSSGLLPLGIVMPGYDAAAQNCFIPTFGPEVSSSSGRADIIDQPQLTQTFFPSSSPSGGGPLGTLFPSRDTPVHRSHEQLSPNYQNAHSQLPPRPPSSFLPGPSASVPMVGPFMSSPHHQHETSLSADAPQTASNFDDALHSGVHSILVGPQERSLKTDADNVSKLHSSIANLVGSSSGAIAKAQDSDMISLPSHTVARSSTPFGPSRSSPDVPQAVPPTSVPFYHRPTLPHPVGSQCPPQPCAGAYPRGVWAEECLVGSAGPLPAVLPRAAAPPVAPVPPFGSFPPGPVPFVVHPFQYNPQQWTPAVMPQRTFGPPPVMFPPPEGGRSVPYS